MCIASLVRRYSLLKECLMGERPCPPSFSHPEVFRATMCCRDVCHWPPQCAHNWSKQRKAMHLIGTMKGAKKKTHLTLHPLMIPWNVVFAVRHKQNMRSHQCYQNLRPSSKQSAYRTRSPVCSFRNILSYLDFRIIDWTVLSLVKIVVLGKLHVKA